MLVKIHIQHLLEQRPKYVQFSDKEFKLFQFSIESLFSLNTNTNNQSNV